MWNTLVSKLNAGMSATAFRFVDMFWSHPIALAVLLFSLFVIIAVVIVELLEPSRVETRRDYVRPVEFPFKR